MLYEQTFLDRADLQKFQMFAAIKDTNVQTYTINTLSQHPVSYTHLDVYKRQLTSNTLMCTGFPHSEISGSKLTYSSPKHIGIRCV